MTGLPKALLRTVLLCLIATECGIRLRAVAPAYLALMAAALSLGLNLVGLAMGGAR